VNLVSRFTELALAFVVKDIKVRSSLFKSVTNILNENAQNAYTLLLSVMSTYCVSSHDYWPVVRAPAACRACPVGVYPMKSPRFLRPDLLIIR